MEVLSAEELTNHLTAHLTQWTHAGSSIKRDFKFKNFVEAFSFMTAIALEAEKMDHHPEWSNVYNMVSISLSTHSSKGITIMDINLADKIDKTYAKTVKG
jgi:4a-hydroxytetrahydrobiopterin dehydratase